MPTTTEFADVMAERSSVRYTGIIKDDSGTALAAASINTLQLTIYNESDGQIINNVDHVNILNVDRGTVDASGNLVIVFTPNDFMVVGGVTQERHVALIEWTFSAGTKSGRHELIFTVKNMTRVG